MKISERELRRRLRASTDTSFEASSSTLGERLQALAMASSSAPPPLHRRWGRRIVAILASIGLVGWLSTGVASASVVLAATGNLPDPVQQFVADAVEVLGVDLPDPEEEREAGGGAEGDDADADIDDGADEDANETDDGGDPNGDEADDPDEPADDGEDEGDDTDPLDPEGDASNAGGNGNSNAGGNAKSNAGGNR